MLQQLQREDYFTQGVITFLVYSGATVLCSTYSIERTAYGMQTGFFTSKKVLHCNGDKMVPFAMYLRPIEIAVEKAKKQKSAQSYAETNRVKLHLAA